MSKLSISLAEKQVSSDQDLLDLRFYENLAIVNPGRFFRSLLAHIEDIVPLEPETAARLEKEIK